MASAMPTSRLINTAPRHWLASTSTAAACRPYVRRSGSRPRCRPLQQPRPALRPRWPTVPRLVHSKRGVDARAVDRLALLIQPAHAGAHALRGRAGWC